MKHRRLFACLLLALLGLAAAGNTEIIPLRRATSAGTDPASWTNKTLLIDWDSASVLTDPLVYEWGDDSGANNDFVQAVAGLKPSLSSAIVFDGTSDEMASNPLSSFFSTAYTSVWALEFTSVGVDSATPYQNDQWAGTPSSRLGFYARSSNAIGVYHYSGAAWVKHEVSVAAAVGKHVVGIRWDGATIYIKIDDGAWSSAALAAPDSLAGTMEIGNGYLDASQYFDGKLYHGVWTSDAKSESEVDDVMTFYNGKIGAY